MTEKRLPELLLPAGSLETLKSACGYGADAVYLGGEAFSLRARAHNFTKEEMAEALSYARDRGVKVYVTANVFAREDDIEGAAVFFEEMGRLKPDALLIADPGMFMTAKAHCPEIPVHISTQANVTNAAAFRFWYDQGVRRIVAARELSLEEIAKIRSEIPEDMEIECFVHGAMCMSYSGRCFLSSYMTGNSANAGACKHPCRYGYALMEETRPGVFIPIEEDARGSYILHPDDLNMIGHLPELIDAGVASLKIEGRMKNSLYVAMCARAYRRALDAFAVSEEEYRAVLPSCEKDLDLVRSREYTTGFYFGRAEAVSDSERTHLGDAVFLGIATESGREGCVRITQRNKFSVGDGIFVMGKDGDTKVKVLAMYREDGEAVSACPHPKEVIDLELSGDVKEGEVLYMVR